MSKCVAIKAVTTEWFVQGGRFSREQFLLALAWKTTVHKSQGMTLDKVVINLDDAKWATGLEFVAFSRVGKATDFMVWPLSFDHIARLNLQTGLKLKHKEHFRLQQQLMSTKRVHQTSEIKNSAVRFKYK